MGILVALLVLSVLIFVHELGHFSVARFFGVRVEVFSIGFGKKIYSKTINNTIWSLSLIPLGGYVQMKGQDDSDPTKISYDEDSYNVKKPWQKILILLAGPFANFIFAFILYISIAVIGVPKLLPIVGGVSDNSPAFSIGLQKNDKIINIDNKTVKYWEDIGKTINSSNGDIPIVVERNNKIIKLIFSPKIISDINVFGEDIKRKVIGISPLGTNSIKHFGFIGSIKYAFDETKKASVLIITSLEKLLTGVVSADKVGGVITIVDITAKASSSGILALLFFTALISVNLGVLNLLPIPALDGGHIMFNIYEIFTGRVASDKAMQYITMFGWLILGALMFLGLYNDINRLIG